MTKNDAIVLLGECKPLADRLAAQGVNVELEEADQAALIGFNKVLLYNESWWLDDPDIHRQAGLGRSDIGTLSFVVGMQSNEKMRHQHEEGELLD